MPRDTALLGLIVRHLASGLSDDSLWSAIDEAGKELEAVEKATHELARGYVRIDIPKMLVELREHVDRAKIAPASERRVFGLFRRLLASPAAFALAARAGRIAQRPFVTDGRLRRLPLVFGRWTATRDLPPVAPKTFHERWKDLA